MQSHPLTRRNLLRTAVGVSLAPMAAIARDNAFPSRPIRFIVPFAAGSGTDMIARIYATTVGQIAGQPVIVENKPGAGGILGTKAVLSAPADGHTVFFASNSALSTNVAVMPNLPYDPVRDLEPLAALEGAYCALVVPASSPYRTLADLVAAAQARPGELNNASGSPTYALWNAWLNEIMRIKTVNISFKGSGEALNAVLASQVDYSIISGGTIANLNKAGRVRVLFYAGPARHPMMPSVPTATELGLPDYRAFAWTAVAVRSGTPASIANELEKIFRKAAQNEDVKRSVELKGNVSLYMGAADARAFQKEEIARWKQLVASTGITAE